MVWPPPPAASAHAASRSANTASGSPIGAVLGERWLDQVLAPLRAGQAAPTGRRKGSAKAGARRGCGPGAGRKWLYSVYFGIMANAGYPLGTTSYKRIRVTRPYGLLFSPLKTVTLSEP